MATKITDIVGKGFAKPVLDEIERRKGLTQGLENTTFYQPYLIIRKLKNLSKVLETRRASPEDYSNEPYAKLGKVFDEGNDLDYSFGLNRMLESNGELRGMAGITNVTIELEDFSFYICTVNFEVNDITELEKFKQTWFSFGIPIELEFGRYQPVNMNDSEDIIPHKEKRVGVMVKFDYEKKSDGRGISGSFKIYSTTWLPVLREGGADQEKIDQFRMNLKNIFVDYHDKIVEAPDMLNPDGNRRLLAFMSQSLVKQIYRAREEIPINETVVEAGIGGEAPKREIDLPTPPYLIKVPDENVTDVQSYILSKFTLDTSVYGSDAYYYVSLKGIEEVLEGVYAFDTMGMKDVNKYFFSGIEVQKFINGNVTSFDMESVLINPYNKKYKRVNGEYVQTSSGNIYLSDDIYISIATIFQIIKNSAGAVSFADQLVGLIRQSTVGLIDLQRRVEETYINGEAITKGISYFDNNTISSPNSFAKFDVEKPTEKIRNFSLATDINDEMASFIFFKSIEGTHIEEKAIDPLKNVYNFYIHFSTEQLYDRYYKDDIPFPNVEIKEWMPISKRYKVHRNEVYKQQSMEKIQRERAKALANQYKNTYRNFTNTINALKERQAEFVGSGRIFNNENYNIALVIYTYYKLVAKEAIDEQRFNMEFNSDGLRRFPMSVSFDLDGIAGILPSQAFKLGFKGFPMQYDISEDEATFVVNSLTHSFQSNEWVTNLGGILYVSPSESIKRELRGEHDAKLARTQELKDIYKSKLLELIPMEEERINRLLNIDFGL